MDGSNIFVTAEVLVVKCQNARDARRTHRRHQAGIVDCCARNIIHD
jgi:hypothetical protein